MQRSGALCASWFNSFAALLLMLLLPSTTLAGPSSPTLGEAGQAVDDFHAALEKGDGEQATSLLDDAVQIYEQGWVEHSKAEYAKEHLPSDLKFSQATTSTQTSRSGVLLGDADGVG